MLYTLHLTIPANTTRSAPAVATITLAPGVVNKVSVGFPWGCVGLAKVAIYERQHQVWPGDPDTGVAWDDYVAEWLEDYELEGPPYELEVRGWNEDDTYNHTILVVISITEWAKAQEARGLLGLFAALRERMRL